jgi:hypothetical protein
MGIPKTAPDNINIPKKFTRFMSSPSFGLNPVAAGHTHEQAAYTRFQRRYRWRSTTKDSVAQKRFKGSFGAGSKTLRVRRGSMGTCCGSHP